MENKADKANLALFSGLISAYTNNPVDTNLSYNGFCVLVYSIQVISILILESA